MKTTNRLPSAIDLMLAKARIAALEAELERSAAVIAEREVRLIELSARLKVLDALEVSRNPAPQRHPSSQIVVSTAIPTRPDEPIAFPVAPLPTLDWVRQAKLAPQAGEWIMELGETVLGTVSDVAVRGEHRTEADKSLGSASLFCRMLGQDPGTLIQIRIQDGKPIDWSEPSVPLAVLDLGNGVAIDDLWFAGGFSLRLRCDVQQPVVLRGYQHDLNRSGLPVLVSEALLAGTGIALGEVRLLNPFLPLLITASTPEGRLIASTLLPFPSLVRGGPHAGEVAAAARGGSHLATLHRLSKTMLERMLASDVPLLSRLLVDVSHATGAEPMFGSHHIQWLQAVMGIVPETLSETLPPHSGRRVFLQESLSAKGLPPSCTGQVLRDLRRTLGQAVLTLPADGIPSLQALTVRAAPESETRRRTGSFILCDAKSGTPSKLIRLPDGARDLTAYQPTTAPVWPVLTGGTPLHGGPLALRFCMPLPASDARTVLPLGTRELAPLLQAAREVTGRIAIMLTGADMSGFRATLARQTLAGEVDILPIPDIRQDTIRARVPNDASFILLADGSVTLFDPHTLEVLRLLASSDMVASAGCTLIGEAVDKHKRVMTFQDGGLQAISPSHTPNVWTLSRTDVRSFLPFATRPTAGNPTQLLMMRVDVWRQLGGFGEGGGVEGYALRAIEAGYQHLTTDAVRVCVDQELEPVGDNFQVQGAEIRARIEALACVFEELSA